MTDDKRLDPFLKSMYKRLDGKLCKECSIHAAGIGPSVHQPDCWRCHEGMQEVRK